MPGHEASLKEVVARRLPQVELTEVLEVLALLQAELLRRETLPEGDAGAAGPTWDLEEATP